MINAAKLQAATLGFKTTFQMSLRSTTAMWNRIAMEVGSATYEEEYGWLKETPGIREWVGDRQVSMLEAEGYKIRNRDFERTFGVDRNVISDDRYGTMTPRFQQLGQDAGEFRDELVFSTLRAGRATPCYDGQFFFDTDHPVRVDENTVVGVSNYGGGVASDTWYLIDDSRMIMPIILQTRQDFDFVALDDPTDQNVFMKRQFIYGVDGRFGAGYGFWQLAYASNQPLTPTTYEAARVAMASVRGDYGKRLNLQGRKLWVPPALEGAGRDVLVVDRNAAGATNKWQGTAELVVSSWLAN